MRTTTCSLIALLSCFAQAQSADPEMIAGMTALRQDDHAKAEAAFTHAVNNNPANARTWYYRGVNRLEQGDLGGALQDLDQSLAIVPDDVHTLLRRAEVRSRMGAEHAATTDLNKILSLRPTGPAAEHALLLLGHFAMAKNDLLKAKGSYDRLISIAPYNAYGWCDRGIVLAAMHQDEEALADLERAIELDPTLDQAHVQKALALFRMDRRQEGCDALRQARDLGDKSVDEILLVYCE